MNFLIPALQALIAFQCIFFLAYLVLDRKLGYTANQVLSGLLLTMGIHMLLNLLNQHLLVGFIPNVALGLGMFYGPIIYLYVQALAYQDFFLSKYSIYHLIPGAIVSLSTLVMWLSFEIYAGAIFISLFIYAILSYRTIVNYQRVLLDTHSEDDRITLKWLGSLLLFQIFLLLINIISVTLSISDFPITSFWVETGLFLFLVAMVSTIILNGLRHPTLFDGVSSEDVKVNAILKKNTFVSHDVSVHRNTTHTQPSEETKKQLIELTEYMTSAKPYLDPALSLKQLANQIGCSTRAVSLLINSALGQNFSYFVNTYRIESAKKMLNSGNMPIIQIMYEVGFNTKSNFNRAFKEISGCTPKQYRAKTKSF